MTEKAQKLGNERIVYTEEYSCNGGWNGGLTKRELFAYGMMKSLISNPERYKYIAGKVSNGMSNNEASAKNAHKAVLLAEALLEELSKTNDNE